MITEHALSAPMTRTHTRFELSSTSPGELRLDGVRIDPVESHSADAGDPR